MRVFNKLSARQVASLWQRGRYGDGGGLWLQVGPNGSKSWIFRYSRAGKARQMGLGPVHAISLKEARERARAARQALIEGIDPLQAKRASRAAPLSVNFAECAERFIAAHEGDWENPKHRAQWRATLSTYAEPVIGAMPVGEIDTGAILEVIEPIWALKPETAGRLRGRMERVLDWARVRGYRAGDNPARWRGHLDKLLPAQRKERRVRHHPALGYADIAAFMARLREYGSISARALEFTILTAARTGETIGATWAEVDLQQRTWTVPAARMKARREHRVPLCDRALEILSTLSRKDDQEVGMPVFHGARGRAPLSNMAMLQMLRGLPEGAAGVTVHGFRSTFRDWAAEHTGFANHVVEAALAHSVADRVEAAYRRGDLYAKRRRLMEAWAKYCERPLAKSEVVPLRQRAGIAE